MSVWVSVFFGLAMITFLKLWLMAREENIQLKECVRLYEHITGLLVPRGQKLTRKDYPELFDMITRNTEKQEDA